MAELVLLLVNGTDNLDLTTGDDLVLVASTFDNSDATRADLQVSPWAADVQSSSWRADLVGS